MISDSLMFKTFMPCKIWADGIQIDWIPVKYGNQLFHDILFFLEMLCMCKDIHMYRCSVCVYMVVWQRKRSHNSLRLESWRVYVICDGRTRRHVDIGCAKIHQVSSFSGDLKAFKGRVVTLGASKAHKGYR